MSTVAEKPVKKKIEKPTIINRAAVHAYVASIPIPLELRQQAGDEELADKLHFTLDEKFFDKLETMIVDQINDKAHQRKVLILHEAKKDTETVLGLEMDDLKLS